MSFEALTKSFETRFKDNWTATPIAYNNAPFNKPDDGSSWVRITVINGAGETHGIAGAQPTVRDTGLVAFQVFVAEESGTQVAMALIDGITPLFEHARFDGILTYTATLAPMGIINGWHQTNVTIPFRRVRNV